jgi:Cu/Ag efflux pump CusA
MQRLIQWSIEHSWLVIGLALLLLGASGWTARQMPIDVFPDLTAPTVTILAEGHGMAPEEMESLVTFPLESAIMTVSALLLVAALLGLTRAGRAFLPDFHEGSLTVQANTLPGTSLAKSNEIGRRVEEILLSQPEVVATARRTGRAEYDEHVQGVEAAEIDVGLKETDRPRAELLAELRRQFATLPGTNVTIGQPISHRIDHMLSGTRANIAIKVLVKTSPRYGVSANAYGRQRPPSREWSTCPLNSRWTYRSYASS